VDDGLDESQPFLAGQGEGVLGDDPVDDPGDPGPELGRVGDVEERLEGVDRLGLDPGPDVGEKGFAPRRRGQRRAQAGAFWRTLDRGRLDGLLGVLECLLNPLAEGHEPDLPRARVADRMGLDRSRPH
jgi:hypothetical protein